MKQEELIQKTFGCVRFVYNHFLEERISFYQKTGQTKKYCQQSKSLTALRKELPWLQEPEYRALQNALRNLDCSYKNFFRRVKCGEKPGFPKYKSKKRGRKTYTTANNHNVIRIDGNRIHLPKLRYVKASVSRIIPPTHQIINATISQEPSGKYFVSLCVKYEPDIKERRLDMQNALGLDYSSPHFYVDSENNVANMPHFFRADEKRLSKEQRKLSKMKRGSNNFKKQKIKVARAYEKIRNSRTDWQHKESKRLADKYDYICVEDINYSGMSRGLHLAKATNDNAFGQFRWFLSYKLEDRGKKLITIDKWFPSSKTCRFCGAINNELTLDQREWNCSCGAHLLRDYNAAINILKRGLQDVS